MREESGKTVGIGAVVLSILILCAVLTLSLFDVFVVKVREFVFIRYGWHMADSLIWILLLFALCVLAGLMGGFDKIPQNLGKLTGFFTGMFRRLHRQTRSG
jgi:hypothetical protein